MLQYHSTLTWRVRKAEEREESARRRERELKEEMARRVKEFVDAQGNRPALHDISSDPDWLDVYTELNAVRARDGKHTHKKQDSSKKGKKDKKGTVMHLVIPVPLPDVPAGIKDGKPDGDTSDTLALPAALHLCFPDLFPTMTSARRSARRGGDPKIYRGRPSQEGDTGAVAASDGADAGVGGGAGDSSGSASISKQLGEELTCRDRVRAGEQLLLHYRRAPLSADDAQADAPTPGGCARRAFPASREGKAASQKLKVVMEDEHMAIIVKPPSLLTVPLGARGTMDVKTLLPSFLNLTRKPPGVPSAGCTQFTTLSFYLL